MSRDVLLLGEELAPGTSPDEVPGVGQGRRPVKASSKGFAHKGGGSCVVATDARVDLNEESDSFILCDAFAQGS